MEVKSKEIKIVDIDSIIPKRKTSSYNQNKFKELKRLMIGRKFERLTIVDFHHRDNCHTYWTCLCSCGVKKVNTKNSLTRGLVKSCGCLKNEIFLLRQTKHNLSRSPIYKTWHAIMQRCYNENCNSYKNYGGRGIGVSSDWHDFENFYRSFGIFKVENQSIDRIDNDGDYSLVNCRWATRHQQNINKRNTVFYEKNGITKPVIVWAKELNIPKQTAYDKSKKGTL